MVSGWWLRSQRHNADAFQEAICLTRVCHQPWCFGMSRKRWVQNTVLLFGSLAFCGILAEILVRILFPAPLPWIYPQVQFEPSPSLIFRMRPDQQSFTADKPFRTNAMGLRGRDTTREKPPGTTRVLVLGDSIAAGFGVREEDTFAQVLERLLNDQGRGEHWEVVNAGVIAYNTLQEVTYFLEEGIRLDPDILIVALYWNDIHDKSRVSVDQFGRLREGPETQATSWWTKLLNSEHSYRLRNFLKRSRLFYLLKDRCGYLMLRIRAQHERDTQTSVLSGADDDRVARGWRSVEAGLEQLTKACRAKGIQLLVAIIPMPQQLARPYPDVRYQSVARAICGRLDIQCLDLLPSFEDVYEGHTSLFISYDGDHPNKRGHELIAEGLYRAIRTPIDTSEPNRAASNK